jgi:hypothetical protein
MLTQADTDLAWDPTNRTLMPSTSSARCRGPSAADHALCILPESSDGPRPCREAGMVLPAEGGRRRRPPAGPALRVYRNLSQSAQQGQS